MVRPRAGAGRRHRHGQHGARPAGPGAACGWRYAGEIEGQGRSADDLAYLRDAGDFRNVLLVEQPNGDFGRTLMRQFLFDAWHLPLLEELEKSSDERIAEIAEKASKRGAYHLERSADLVIRLGDGTAGEPSPDAGRARRAVAAIHGELFAADAVDAATCGGGHRR